MDEDQVSFEAKQGHRIMHDEENGSSKEIEIRADAASTWVGEDTHAEVDLCWTKLDKKPKKLTWMISSNNDHVKQKANKDTTVTIEERIVDLGYKLSQI